MKSSVYDILYKTSTRPKPLWIRFDKMDGFIMVLDGKMKHFALFDYGMYDKICNKIKHIMSKKSGLANIINHNFVSIKIDSYNSLPIELRSSNLLSVGYFIYFKFTPVSSYLMFLMDVL